jgi:hypothetical protein
MPSFIMHICLRVHAPRVYITFRHPRTLCLLFLCHFGVVVQCTQLVEDAILGEADESETGTWADLADTYKKNKATNRVRRVLA